MSHLVTNVSHTEANVGNATSKWLLGSVWKSNCFFVDLSPIHGAISMKYKFIMQFDYNNDKSYTNLLRMLREL